MADLSCSKKDGNRKKDEVFDIASEVRETCPTHVVDILAEYGRIQQQILHRVPPQVREEYKHIYEPSVVSFGAYYHGQPHLRRYEHFKKEVLDIILNSEAGVKEKARVFRSEIQERVHEIRIFYGGLSKDEHDDEELVEMMVRDACLILYYMEIQVKKEERCNHFNQSIGQLGFSFMEKDFYKLENQIPWWIIKKLVSLIYDRDNKDEGKGNPFILKYLSFVTFGDFKSLERVPWNEGTKEEPLHLLEAYRRVNLKEEIHNNTENSVKCELRWGRKGCPSSNFALLKRQFLSATELKAKGIYFRPTSVHLDGIMFSSHSFYGVLHLPILVVDHATTTYFSNVIVLENSPGNTSGDFRVTSYINFMKSLIEKAADVKLLQEKGILISNLEDNENIVKIFKKIDTHGRDNFYLLEDIKGRIEEHCNSYRKTWIAELIVTKFRTPWSALAVFAAAFLLALTLLQTYYTMNPRNCGN